MDDGTARHNRRAGGDPLLSARDPHPLVSKSWCKSMLRARDPHPLVRRDQLAWLLPRLPASRPWAEFVSQPTAAHKLPINTHPSALARDSPVANPSRRRRLLPVPLRSALASPARRRRGILLRRARLHRDPVEMAAARVLVRKTFRISAAGKLPVPFTPWRLCSPRHLSSDAAVMAEELLKAVKEPPSEACQAKMTKLAEQLVIALKKQEAELRPKAEALVVKCNVAEDLKISSLESAVSDLKATVAVSSVVTFTILGIIGCVLLTLPDGIHQVKVQCTNTERICTEKFQRLDKKLSKLKETVCMERKEKPKEPEEDDEELDAAPRWWAYLRGLIGC